jgi:AcrR family transcriptional regulator
MPRVSTQYLETKRKAILDAAVTCFARNGFHRATIPDIAAEAAVSTGAIYRYFASKEEIVEAIARAHRTPSPAVLDDVGTRPDVPSALRTLIDASFGALHDSDEQRWRRVTVQLWAEALRDEGVMRIVREGRDEPVERIAALIRRGQVDGTIRTDIDATAGARMCASLFYGFVLQQATDPKVDVDRYVEAVRSTLDAFLAARREWRGFDDLAKEAERAPIVGWDFSWLVGRATEERPSWGYSRLLAERMAHADSALDIETGGGEVIADLPGLAAFTIATEGWGPMIALADARLRPLGVRLLYVPPTSSLPFADDSFDLVSSRHPTTTDWGDVRRVLRPGGTFLTQQVGSQSVDELGSLFRGPATGRRSLETLRADALAAGLDVVRAEEERPQTVFYDIGAVVYFLRLVVWIVPDFSVERYRRELMELHERIEREGRFVAHSHRVLIEARKPRR